MSIVLILAFCTALFLSLTFTPIVRNWASSRGWLDMPQLERHVHTIPVPRIGGVVIFGSFTSVILGLVWVTVWLSWPIAVPFTSIRNLLGPALIIFLLGLYDDLRGVSPHWKFLVQGIAATMLFFGGYGIHRLDLLSSGHPLQTITGLPLTIFWVLLITNAFNLIDGLDGLAAGSALFSVVIVFILSLLTPNLMVSFVAVALAGSILGFLRYNFHPASIFLGDSGSLFLGFMISALAIAGSQKAPTMIAVAIPVVSLGLPILDVTLAVSRRFLRGNPLFEGDRDHIHHQLLKRGLSQREAVLFLYVVTAAFGFLSLLILHHATAIALILALTGITVLIGLRQLRYTEFDEILSIVRRSTNRRQFVMNHVTIRRAAESLKVCNDFNSICEVLQAVLRPIGFDGFLLQMLHPNGFSASSFHPMSYEPDGKLLFSWSESEINNPPWELRLELDTSSNQCWGYFSLVRLSADKAIALDLNVLSMDFRQAVSRAIERACDALESSKADSTVARPTRARHASTGSS